MQWAASHSDWVGAATFAVKSHPAASQPASASVRPVVAAFLLASQQLSTAQASLAALEAEAAQKAANGSSLMNRTQSYGDAIKKEKEKRKEMSEQAEAELMAMVDADATGKQPTKKIKPHTPEEADAAAERKRQKRARQKAQKRAAKRAADVNEAYGVLRHAVRRAGHLLELHGVDLQELERQPASPDFLFEQMMIRERVQDFDSLTSSEASALVSDLSLIHI